MPVNTAYYLVVLRNSSAVNSSEVFRFNIDTTCSKALRNYRFTFKNRLGGFDAYTFMGQFERNYDFKKSYYKSLGGKWSSNTYTYNSTYRSEKQYNTVGQDTFTAWSGWITEDESNWLSELIDSPEVYITYPNGTALVPVNIVDTTYQYKTTSKDQLFNLQVKFKPTFDKVRQQW